MGKQQRIGAWLAVMLEYFMVNGSLTGSWRGLTPDTIPMTWDGGAKALYSETWEYPTH